MTADELNNRLQNYFMSEPHKWFDTYEQALKPLGVSYQKGAAHVDLSPRATISMENAAKSGHEQLFTEMVEQDIKWFFQLLQACNQSRLLIVTGCVTRWYSNDFVKRLAPAYQFRFNGALSLNIGKGRTGFYCISGPGVDNLPVFFCSISPSARTTQEKQMLIKRVEENQEKLRGYINGQSCATKS